MKQAKQANEVIQITYRKIIDLVSTGRLAELEQKPFPRKVSFWVGRVIDKFDDELKSYNRQLSKLIDKNASRDPKGNKIKRKEFPDGRVQWDIADENKEAHEKEVDELLDTEIDVHVYRMKIKLSWLYDYRTGDGNKRVKTKRLKPADLRPLISIADIEDDLADEDNEEDFPETAPQPSAPKSD